jgi:hypothetical protein
LQTDYKKSFSQEIEQKETRVETQNCRLNEDIFANNVMKLIQDNFKNIKSDSKEEYILGIHRGSMNLLLPEMLHTVDFTMFRAEAVLYHASNTWNEVAAIRNPTFMPQI